MGKKKKNKNEKGMKPLKSYIPKDVCKSESGLLVESVSSFDYVTNLDNLFTIEKFKFMKSIDGVKTLIREILSKKYDEHQLETVDVFRYSLNKSFFKLDYNTFYDIILSLKDKYSDRFDFIVVPNSSIKVMTKGSKRGRIIFKTSKKTRNVISTQAQELSTCKIFNTFMSDPNKPLNTEEYDSFYDIIKEYSPHFKQDWLSHYGKQMNTLINFIKDYLNANPYDYRAIRYGDITDIKHDQNLIDVVMSHKNFVKSWANKCEMKKDAIDPTDIILVNINVNPKEICNIFDRLTNKVNGAKTVDDLIDIRQEYINSLILYNNGKLKHIFLPISLKKICNESGRYDVMNIKRDMKICNISKSVLTFNGTNVTIDCFGRVDFRGFTDDDGNEYDIEDHVKIVMRTYGDGYVGIDCSVVVGRLTNPTVGKTPTDKWRNLLKCDKKDDIYVCMSKFMKLLGLSDNIGKFEIDNGHNKLFNTIITDAAKAGPNCLPFIFVH